MYTYVYIIHMYNIHMYIIVREYICMYIRQFSVINAPNKYHGSNIRNCKYREVIPRSYVERK